MWQVSNVRFPDVQCQVSFVLCQKKIDKDLKKKYFIQFFNIIGRTGVGFSPIVDRFVDIGITTSLFLTLSPRS